MYISVKNSKPSSVYDLYTFSILHTISCENVNSCLRSNTVDVQTYPLFNAGSIKSVDKSTSPQNVLVIRLRCRYSFIVIPISATRECYCSWGIKRAAFNETFGSLPNELAEQTSYFQHFRPKGKHSTPFALCPLPHTDKQSRLVHSTKVCGTYLMKQRWDPLKKSTV